MTTSIELEAPFGFSLSAAAEFYAGFAPMGGAARKLEQSLQLVLRLDGTFEAVSARLKQRGTLLTVEVEGTKDTGRLVKQLSRMLGLGVDGRAWAAVGEVDPVLGAVKRHIPGFFTAGFPSPYEAGIGGVLSQRSSVRQAAATRKADFARCAEAWRPFRMWASIVLVRNLARVGAWNPPLARGGEGRGERLNRSVTVIT